MPKLRSSHLGSANPSPDRTERGRKPKMKKMSTVKRKVARSISTARRATTGNKLSKRFVGIRMSRIQKGLNRGRLRKSGSSTNTPLSRSPHGKLSPIKTRRLYKSKQVNVSRCTICKTSEGDLTSCTQCHKLYHLSKCILYSAYMIARVAHVNWLCPKCIRCSSCHLMIDDPTNVECVHCLQAWHGACQPPGSTEVDRQFFCKNCLECVSQPEGSRKSSNGTPRRSSKNLNKPSSSTTTPLRPETCSSENQRRKRRRSKGSTGAGQVAVTDITPPSCSGTPQEAESEEAKEAVDPPKFFLSSPKSRKDLDSSPERKSVLSDLPDICSSSLGGKLFDVALAKMEEMGMEKKPNATKEKEQWVNIGGESDLKVLYDSPYPDDIKSVPLFFVCAYCLKPFSEQSSYFVHQDCCPRIAPPGREIYRDSHSSLSFFEVDGAVERTYCRYLCLLAMLFISSKTSHNEVGTF
nr:MOZ SAS protein domain containing protein [Haemonchus contortus]